MTGVPPVIQLLPKATEPSPQPPAEKRTGFFRRLWAAIKRLFGI